ncbi:MAG: hypothetical protein NTV79_10805 [Candidatus Aureabacteria bacterium]|nr:hypothetical protein [Candidatus Auribacterota bacterium]
MGINQDFRDLFASFNAGRVEYLVAGAYAVMYYAAPRFTKDLDVWINPTPENARRTWKALGKFGAPMIGVSEGDFTNRDMVYQIGIEPNRIDVIMGIAGCDFPPCWKHRVKSMYGGIPIFLMGADDLLRSKQCAARPQDLLDAENLKKAVDKKSRKGGS